MSDHSALEAHLRAQPEDRGGWLVYADWLMQRGDARGDLIGLELNRPDAPSSDRKRIERSLRSQHKRWADLLPEGSETTWRYGFPARIVVPWSKETAEALSVALSHPDARFLTSLGLRADDDDEGWDDEDGDDEERDDEDPEDSERDETRIETWLEALLTLDLTRITALDLAYAGIGAKGMEILSRWRHTSSLVSLDLRYNRIGDQGASALAASPIARALRTLHLHRNNISATGAIALAQSPYLRSLAHLDLRDNPILTPGALALADAPILCGLRTLLLYRSDVGPEGAAALAASKTLPLDIRRFWRAS